MTDPMFCYRCGSRLGKWTEPNGLVARRSYRLTGDGPRCEVNGACAARRTIRDGLRRNPPGRLRREDRPTLFESWE